MSARRPRVLALGAALAAALALSACGDPAPGGTAQTALSSDFVGLVSEETLSAPPAQRRRLLRRQADLGVRMLRQRVDWSRVETAPGRYRFGELDRYVADVARSGMTIMPVLFQAPTFHASDLAPGSRSETVPAPRSLAAMTRFARAMVRRYGSDGLLWRRRADVPRRPIRAWQLWNEPNVPDYWGGKPDAREYARMLKHVGGAIKREDEAAEIVTAGLPESRLGIGFERYVRDLFKAGAQGSFDTLAIHPYARTPAGVSLAVTTARRLLATLGYAEAGIRVTEMGWATGGPRSPFTVGEDGQESFVRVALTDLGRTARELNVRGVVYFNWRDARPPEGRGDFWGLHTGLLDRQGRPKPSYRAFARAVSSLPQREG